MCREGDFYVIGLMEVSSGVMYPKRFGEVLLRLKTANADVHGGFGISISTVEIASLHVSFFFFWTVLTNEVLKEKEV